MKYFLSIAASDNCGGAGIQKDLRVAAELGYWGLSAITALTVQDDVKVDAVFPVPASILLKQIKKNFSSYSISAVKIGVICSDENMIAIADYFKKTKFQNIVLDTVFAPSRGSIFVSKASVSLFKEKLLPLVKIITPNRHELALLSGIEINTIEEGIIAAKQISQQYGCCVYLKGGHFNDEVIKEILVQKGKVDIIEKRRITYKNPHGTGCTFSSALSCFLGDKMEMKKACSKATLFVDKMYK
jgi:hydroxymethylpyrimidine/phosphomethylpyrimidine kinase